ncbi:hypothetical protein evm_004074 [Chilo suppressalis]|nr:hypothetical protein evm_004074 [Chilo suppressalis]
MKWNNNRKTQWTGMSEQHPLLYENLSEEEQSNPHFQRRLRPMVLRGRARNKVKGAVAIIKQWPGHWSSTLTYWWIGLGMIAIVTLIVYNSISAFALLPMEHLRGIRTRISNTVKDTISEENKETQNVFMHLFVENNKEVELNNYMPYIEIIAKKFPDYNYKIVIITNDTNAETNALSAEENNENAFNLLWTNKHVQSASKSNIKIQHTSLSKHMENSPLRNNWRNLPNQFIPFLVRAVSIWDKGGITFNPTILTPRSPHAIYIEKLQHILRNYPLMPKNTLQDMESMNKTHHGLKKKVNNIRDIIYAMENESEDNLSTEESLDAAENKNDIFILDNLQNTSHYLAINKVTSSELHKNEIHGKTNTSDEGKVRYHLKTNETTINKDNFLNQQSKNGMEVINTSIKNNTNSIALLPMFLNFLFKNKPLSETNTDSDTQEPITKSRKRKHVLLLNSNKNKTLPDKMLCENLKPIIVPANSLKSFSPTDDVEKINGMNQFAIDLKGNLIASVIPCHAFLGSIFSNLVHYNQESITDFIISELSTFCKGVLSSCNGIDVILL